MTAINQRFNEEELEIPFAKQDVYTKAKRPLPEFIYKDEQIL